MNIRMKSPWLFAALVAAGVTMAGTAMARGDCSHASNGDRAEKVSMMKERHAARVSEHFDTLAARLELRDEQQPVWLAFRSGLSERPSVGPRHERGTAMSAPERMQGMERAAEARLEHVRKMRELTEGLYAVLDDEQRKVFDEQRQFARGGMHQRGDHKHGGHG